MAGAANQATTGTATMLHSASVSRILGWTRFLVGSVLCCLGQGRCFLLLSTSASTQPSLSFSRRTSGSTLETARWSEKPNHETGGYASCHTIPSAPHMAKMNDGSPLGMSDRGNHNTPQGHPYDFQIRPECDQYLPNCFPVRPVFTRNASLKVPKVRHASLDSRCHG